MTLPAFASTADLEARMGSEGGTTRAQAALDDASALIRAEAGKTWVTDDELDADVPDILLTVTCSAARRSIENPDAAKSMTVGDATLEFANASNDVYLTTAEKELVRAAAGKARGLFTISTTREDPVYVSDLGIVEDRLGTIYADVVPEGQPIPILDIGEFLP